MNTAATTDPPDLDPARSIARAKIAADIRRLMAPDIATMHPLDTPTAARHAMLTAQTIADSGAIPTDIAELAQQERAFQVNCASWIEKAWLMMAAAPLADRLATGREVLADNAGDAQPFERLAVQALDAMAAAGALEGLLHYANMSERQVTAIFARRLAAIAAAIKDRCISVGVDIDEAAALGAFAAWAVTGLDY